MEGGHGKERGERRGRDQYVQQTHGEKEGVGKGDNESTEAGQRKHRHDAALLHEQRLQQGVVPVGVVPDDGHNDAHQA